MHEQPVAGGKLDCTTQQLLKGPVGGARVNCECLYAIANVSQLDSAVRSQDDCCRVRRRTSGKAKFVGAVK